MLFDSQTCINQLILKGLVFICVTHGANALQTNHSNKNHRKIQKVLPDTLVEQDTMYSHRIPKTDDI